MPGQGAYEKKKEAARRRSAAMSAAGRDIGPLPPVADHARKREALFSFRAYCESYFPHRFALAWSDDHLTAIRRIETAVLDEGRFALAMPRGSGKSTLCETAVMWASSIGRHEFVVLIGSCADAAEAMLANIKAEFTNNALLLEDWPEICFPLRSLEGQSRRCVGQLCCGAPTLSKWDDDRIVLPNIAGSRGASAMIRVAGLTGNLRGMSFTRPDGRKVRPSLVVADDPQTDASARSPSQCAQRERIILGAVLGLAGPGRRVSCLMPTTVIRKGDMSDRFLDREIHPSWHGERFKLLYEWPKRRDLWDHWWNEHRAELVAGGDGGQARQFLVENFEAMHEGPSGEPCRVGWKERYGADEVSALHNCMAWHYSDPVAFACEAQNDPPAESTEDEAMPPAKQLAVRFSGFARGVVPVEATWLTCFVDVQQTLLYWLVAGWSDRGQGWVVDYGTNPEQSAGYFTLSTAAEKLADRFPGLALEAQLTAGLAQLVDVLAGHAWPSADGGTRRIERLLIDANWGEQTETVYEFCRRTPHAAIVSPSHGKFYGASTQTHIDQYKKRPGERLGPHWLVSKGGKRTLRHVIIDTNYWKSFVAARLACPSGQADALTFFGGGETGQLARHDMLADHCRSEYRVRVAAKGRQVDEWKLRPGCDNHWWDCLGGSAVGASLLGLTPTAIASAGSTGGNAATSAPHGASSRAGPVDGARRLTFAERQALARAKRQE